MIVDNKADAETILSLAKSAAYPDIWKTAQDKAQSEEARFAALAAQHVKFIIANPAFTENNPMLAAYVKAHGTESERTLRNDLAETLAKAAAKIWALPLGATREQATESVTSELNAAFKAYVSPGTELSLRLPAYFAELLAGHRDQVRGLQRGAA
jgi:hypothetical protein